MFQFQAKFLQKPTTATTIMPHAATGDAAKTTTTNNHLRSRLLQERQRKSFNKSVMYGCCKQSTHTSRFE
jgi:hypothetical protein